MRTLVRMAPVASLALSIALWAPPRVAAAGGDESVEVPEAEVQEALAQAGANRGELEKAIAHFRVAGDARRLTAIRFLVANMPGRGYVVTRLKTEKGETVPWDALAYPDFKAAQAAIDALEKQHGTLDFDHDRLVADLETVRADFLVRSVDGAFAAWEASPPAWRIGFRAFLDYVLPYRGSEEPLDDWRGPLAKRHADLRTPAEGGARALWEALSADVSRRVRFDERYYLHPTDQGFSEMEKSGMGRCEDITNMTTYAARARALATAADYTPAWGHRDNNHAWNVLLDAEGKGSDPVGRIAAKVYRKTFALQRGNLAFLLPAGRAAPNRFLKSKSYVDVTDQYAPTTDVTVALDAKAVGTEGFAYLCVFNGGEWTAIHWARVERDAEGGARATFTKMGRNLAYLPAVHDGKTLLPAAPPLLLHVDGRVETLAGRGNPAPLVVVATSPEQASVDTKAVKPVSHLTAGTTYVLKRWDGDWRDVGERVAGAEPLAFEGLPSDALYWLVVKASDRLERIFTTSADGIQRWW